MPMGGNTSCTSNNCFEAPANGVNDHRDGGWSAEADPPHCGEIETAGAQTNSSIGCHLEFSDLVHAHEAQHDNSMQRQGSDHRTDRINVASPFPISYDGHAVMMQEDVRSQECRHTEHQLDNDAFVDQLHIDGVWMPFQVEIVVGSVMKTT